MNHLRPSVLSLRQPPRARLRRPGWIGLAVALSVLLHIVALGLITVAARRPAKAPPAEGAVELLMVEKKGAEASQPAPPEAKPQRQPEKAAPPQPKAEQRPQKTPAPRPQAKTERQMDRADLPLPPVPVAEKGDEPAPVPPPPVKPPPVKPPPVNPETPQAKPPEPRPPAKPQPPAPPVKASEPAPAVQPAPPTPRKGPVFDLSGTDSISNAEVIGGKVLPASPDNRFRNRPPPYPMEAARRGEQGTVTVLIHVGADGTATGVELVESSGYASLDQAAMMTVRTWHFHPALRDSEPVPFDMPFRFQFQAN